MMIRKWLFWGLTLVLLTTLVLLVIRGRQLESEQAHQLTEVVQVSKPTATRLLAPQDLVIVRSEVRWEDATADGATRSARHRFLFRNDGKIAYSRIGLALAYVNRNGKVLLRKGFSIDQLIAPGSVLETGDVLTENVPGEAVDCRVTVAYCDMAAEARPELEVPAPVEN